MVQARSKDLQKKLVMEALSLMELGDHSCNVANYEQAVRLIGKACGIPRSETEAQLGIIRQNRDDLRRIQNGETVAKRVFTDEDSIMSSWSGLETFDTLMDLFEVSLLLERHGERRALFDLAQELVETQVFLDWIEKTPAEQELPEIAAG